jgi:hypothetical protein
MFDPMTYQSEVPDWRRSAAMTVTIRNEVPTATTVSPTTVSLIPKEELSVTAASTVN